MKVVRIEYAFFIKNQEKLRRGRDLNSEVQGSSGGFQATAFPGLDYPAVLHMYGCQYKKASLSCTGLMVFYLKN